LLHACQFPGLPKPVNMKYKLGEFVRFVNERREGYITRIIDEHTIAVTDEDGFEIPVLASQVTRVHGQTDSSEELTVETNSDIKTSQFISNGIFLAISPDKRSPSVVHFHLINSSSWQLLITLYTRKKNQHKGEYAGILKAQSTIQIYSCSLNELDLWPEFSIQVLLFSPGNEEIQKPIEFSEKFKAKDFSGEKKQHELLEQAAWLIQLDSPEPIIDPEKLKESFFRPHAEKIQIEKPGKEVDLHIEKLRDDYQFLNSSEILDIQMSHFRKSLDAAIVHKIPSIIFIHGSGNSTLRNEIHKTISKHAQVKTFMDAHKERFGYGATEVFFK
jgi:hypothetical protein